MKRIALAGLVAVAVALGASQTASAGCLGVGAYGSACGFSFNFSARISWCDCGGGPGCGYPCTYAYWPGFNYGGVPYDAGCASGNCGGGYGGAPGYDAASYYKAYAAQQYAAPAYAYPA